MEVLASTVSQELTDGQLHVAKRIVAIHGEFRDITNQQRASRNPIERVFGRIAAHFDDQAAEALLMESGMPVSLQEAEAHFART